jgi:hypothetical protein
VFASILLYLVLKLLINPFASGRGNECVFIKPWTWLVPLDRDPAKFIEVLERLRNNRPKPRVRSTTMGQDQGKVEQQIISSEAVQKRLPPDMVHIGAGGGYALSTTGSSTRDVSSTAIAPSLA